MNDTLRRAVAADVLNEIHDAAKRIADERGEVIRRPRPVDPEVRRILLAHLAIMLDLVIESDIEMLTRAPA